VDSAFLLFIFSVLAALAAWWLGRRILPRLKQRIRPRKIERTDYEDALKVLYKMKEDERERACRGVADQMEISFERADVILDELAARGLIRAGKGRYHFTSAGAEYAVHIIRAHRLWERYLADRTGISAVEWHSRADKLEHELSPEQVDALSAQLGNPTFDPHGDPVPTSPDSLMTQPGFPLTEFQAGRYGRIRHLEDEPAGVFAELVERGLHPGMEFEVLSRSEDQVEILSEGETRVLDTRAAANVTAEPIAEAELDFRNLRRLSDLNPGESARIVRISQASRGAERRRFMDLGILPGAVASAEMRGPTGDPTAYRIRGALIALRKEQARRIFVRTDDRRAA